MSCAHERAARERIDHRYYLQWCPACGALRTWDPYGGEPTDAMWAHPSGPAKEDGRALYDRCAQPLQALTLDVEHAIATHDRMNRPARLNVLVSIRDAAARLARELRSGLLDEASHDTASSGKLGGHEHGLLPERDTERLGELGRSPEEVGAIGSPAGLGSQLDDDRVLGVPTPHAAGGEVRSPAEFGGDVLFEAAPESARLERGGQASVVAAGDVLPDVEANEAGAGEIAPSRRGTTTEGEAEAAWSPRPHPPNVYDRGPMRHKRPGEPDLWLAFHVRDLGTKARIETSWLPGSARVLVPMKRLGFVRDERSGRYFREVALADEVAVTRLTASVARVLLKDGYL